ncbi:hypothetical protein M569_11201, partial [Genlisea aurea]
CIYIYFFCLFCMKAEEMMRALDGLLEDIEVKDGFIDSSISSQISPVMELEESMWALSERCRIYKVCSYTPLLRKCRKRLRFHDSAGPLYELVPVKSNFRLRRHF